MTKREIVQSFKNLYANGRQTDDVRISDRQWSFIVDYHRAQLIRQQVEKGQSLNENLIQELGAYNETTKQRELKVPKQANGRWYTDLPIPQAVEVYQQNLLTFVGTIYGEAFQKTNQQRAQWEQYAKYTAKKPKWFQLGNILHLLTPPSPTLNIITVKGVFERPLEVLRYNKQQVPEIDELDYEYPISAVMLDTLYQLMAERELKLSIALPKDLVNDGVERDANG